MPEQKNHTVCYVARTETVLRDCMEQQEDLLQTSPDWKEKRIQERKGRSFLVKDDRLCCCLLHNKKWHLSFLSRTLVPITAPIFLACSSRLSLFLAVSALYLHLSYLTHWQTNDATHFCISAYLLSVTKSQNSHKVSNSHRFVTKGASYSYFYVLQKPSSVVLSPADSSSSFTAGDRLTFRETFHHLLLFGREGMREHFVDSSLFSFTHFASAGG